MNHCDLVSSATHLGTAAWAVFATLILVRITRGHGAGRWAVGVYGASMVLLYLASGTFHGLLYRMHTPGGVRADVVADLWVVQRLDKSAIFLLIAGSYTPVFVYFLEGAWRRWGLRAVWGFAAAGVATIWLWPGHPHSLLVGVYAGMGVAGLVGVRRYFRAIGWRGMAWVAALAGAYLLGAAAEVAGWPVIVPGWVGPHEVLHVADILGTLIHFAFVLRFVIPYRAPVYYDARIGEPPAGKAVPAASPARRKRVADFR